MKARNIKISYCYRDAGNNKQHGAVVFANTSGKNAQEIEAALRAELIDGLWFVAAEWGLPDLHFKDYSRDDELDHNWHELVSVEETEEEVEDKMKMLLKMISRTMKI